ncbi:protein translocase subunit SecD [Streptomyces sp. NPDC001027]|uniref:protein translocase subunit SecD n=1 Tax=Streptomyces sp. NPDC001027 TaxID=3154771 RepID=UPI003328F84D
MQRSPLVRGLLALAVVALSLYVALTVPVHLGLDLRGGTQIVLETRPADPADAGAEVTDRTVEVLRGRIDALGVAEPVIARSGSDRIVVELPGVQDPRKAADVLGRTAQLTFHQVLGTADDADGTSDSLPKRPHEQVTADESGRPLRLRAAALTGKDVAKAAARFDQQTGAGWHVTVDFKGAGEAGWARLTGEAACRPPGDPGRRVAIVLDDRIISSPQVDPSVACRSGISGGSTQITGSFDDGEAKELALLVNGGALPVPVETVEQRTVGPTLGARAIEASAWAAVVGAAATSLFVIAVYRITGVLATVALACYGLISYAALAALGATLTLPGLAGFVLAIGMAVDANVLVFERAREEYAARRRPTPRSSLTVGFHKALSAIADSNITTLIAAGLLFWFASGPVRGFGVTLGIGVLASMLSALVVTRALADLVVGRPGLRRRPRLTGIAHTGAVRARLARTNPGLLRRPRRWLAVSAAALLLAGSGIAVRGVDLGVEFTGGRLVEYAVQAPVDADRARSALADAGFPRAVVQTSGENRFTVRTHHLSEAQAATLTDAVTDLAPQADKIRDESIGPSLGEELRHGALVALVVALGAQLLYLAARFRWLLGSSAVVALAHDVVILVGVFAWLGKPVDGVFLAALLTVIGYSVNDSVVVFDRIRELGRRDRGSPFARVAEQALLQTLPRTVSTGMGAAFILTALAVLGGDTLTDFALALLVGLVVGTWSSMFTATPLAVELHRLTRAGSSRGRGTLGRPSGGLRGP